MTEDGRLTQSTSDKVWKIGRRPVKRVRLASGLEIKATGEHRLLGPDGWAHVRDLVVNDRLAIVSVATVLPAKWALAVNPLTIARQS